MVKDFHYRYHVILRLVVAANGDGKRNYKIQVKGKTVK
jgi:hypothetical protein